MGGNNAQKSCKYFNATRAEFEILYIISLRKKIPKTFFYFCCAGYIKGDSSFLL